MATIQVLLLSVIVAACLAEITLTALILWWAVKIAARLWHVRPRETRCVKELAWATRDVSEALSSGNHQALKSAVSQLEVKAAKVKEAGLA